MMSGLPGAGKDHWIANNAPDWPVVSLDKIRQELRVKPEETQGVVVKRAKERARAYLRQSEPSVWNATDASAANPAFSRLSGACLYRIPRNYLGKKRRGGTATGVHPSPRSPLISWPRNSVFPT